MFRALGHFVEFFFADHVDGGLDQIADHRFHVAPDVAHFRVLRRFHLYKGATGEPRKPAGNFRFADAGGTDH